LEQGRTCWFRRLGKAYHSFRRLETPSAWLPNSLALNALATEKTLGTDGDRKD
jgi:hypothetical protein